MRGVIRHMVERFSTEEVAYAMDTTGFCFDDGPHDRSSMDAGNNKPLATWRQAQRAFLDMPEPERDHWRARVRHYPTLAGLARLA